MDPAKRADDVKQMEQVFYDQVPEVTLLYKDNLEAYRSDRWAPFEVQPDPGGQIMFQNGYWSYLRSHARVTRRQWLRRRQRRPDHRHRRRGRSWSPAWSSFLTAAPPRGQRRPRMTSWRPRSPSPTVAGGNGPAAAGTPRFVLTKIGGGIVSLLLVVVLGFFLFRVLPGDPVRTMTHGAPIGTKQLLALRAQLGLDKPLIVQFFDYLGNLLHGDFGTSYLYNQPVGDLVLAALWPTVLLVGTATVIAIALGLWLGTARGLAARLGVRQDVHTGIALTLWSVPQFWLGIILILVFAQGIGPVPGMFPVQGMTSPDTPPGFPSPALDLLHHLVLPCLTLVAAVYAQYLLIMRSSLLEEMGADYLVTARAKGLREDIVRRRHAVPNALLPTVTLIFLNLGLVVTARSRSRWCTRWPGLGLLMYKALQRARPAVDAGRVHHPGRRGDRDERAGRPALPGARPEGAAHDRSHRPRAGPPGAARSGGGWAQFAANRAGLVGLVVLVVIGLLAMLAPLLTDAGRAGRHQGHRGPAAAGPSGGYLLGTDDNGRSVLLLPGGARGSRCWSASPPRC